MTSTLSHANSSTTTSVHTSPFQQRITWAYEPPEGRRRSVQLTYIRVVLSKHKLRRCADKKLPNMEVLGGRPEASRISQLWLQRRALCLNSYSSYTLLSAHFYLMLSCQHIYRCGCVNWASTAWILSCILQSALQLAYPRMQCDPRLSSKHPHCTNWKMALAFERQTPWKSTHILEYCAFNVYLKWCAHTVFITIEKWNFPVSINCVR